MAEKNCENCAREDCLFIPPVGKVHCDYWYSDAPAVNRWIPCAERMPDKYEFVLCFCRANITEVLYWNGSIWHSTDAYRGYLSGFVTHWMKLPEPPEVNSDAD